MKDYHLKGDFTKVVSIVESMDNYELMITGMGSGWSLAGPWPNKSFLQMTSAEGTSRFVPCTSPKCQKSNA